MHRIASSVDYIILFSIASSPSRRKEAIARAKNKSVLLQFTPPSYSFTFFSNPPERPYKSPNFLSMDRPMVVNSRIRQRRRKDEYIQRYTIEAFMLIDRMLLARRRFIDSGERVGEKFIRVAWLSGALQSLFECRRGLLTLSVRLAELALRSAGQFNLVV